MIGPGSCVVARSQPEREFGLYDVDGVKFVAILSENKFRNPTRGTGCGLLTQANKMFVTNASVCTVKLIFDYLSLDISKR